MAECKNCKKIKLILAQLVDLYVANIGTDSEFITCITPKGAFEMTFFQRNQSKVWSAWDAARAALGGKYIKKVEKL